MIDVLVLCGDYWHPAEVVKRGLSPLAGDAFRFDFVEDAKDILSPAMIREYPLIMNCKADELSEGNNHTWFDDVTEANVAELKRYTEEGHGFLSVHSGNAFFLEKSPDYCAFVGNSFVTHPPRCDVHAKITANHPVTAGVKDFDVRDEHYEIKVTAEDIDVLFVTTSEKGGTQTGGYAKPYGKGRLCVLTPGHILSVWQHPQYRRMLSNAIRWCAGET